MAYTSQTELVVRYSETDQMGIVHHSRYFPWFEAGRTDFIKKSGLSYSQMESLGVLLPLIEASAKYIESAKYEDEIIIETSLEQLGVVRCSFLYKVIRKSDNKQLALGSTSHAFVDSDFKPINLKKKNQQVWQHLNKLI